MKRSIPRSSHDRNSLIALGPFSRPESIAPLGAADRRARPGLTDRWQSVLVDLPDGWHGSSPAPVVAVARAGEPVDSPLSDGRRYEMSISEVPPGFRLLIIDWSDESSVASDHSSLDAAKGHAVAALNEHGVDWQARTPPGAA